MAIIKSRIFSYKFKSVIIPSISTIQSYLSTSTTTYIINSTAKPTNTTTYRIDLIDDFNSNNVLRNASENILLCIFLLFVYYLIWY